MNSYILLRNNKESSSLSLEDLRKIGLKTSDLIWVECQSVGWRTPQEITELKVLLPEQKNQVPLEVLNPLSLAGGEMQVPEFAFDETGKKDELYVDSSMDLLPDRKQVEMQITNTDSTQMDQYAGLRGTVKPVIETTADEINLKYSRPLDEIKEMYLRNLEQSGRGKNNRLETGIPQKIKKALVYTGLVLSGAILMLFIYNLGGKRSITAIQTTRPPASTKPASAEPITTLSENLNTNTPAVNEEATSSSGTIPSELPEEKTSTPPIKKEVAEKKNRENKANPVINKAVTEKNKPALTEVVTIKPFLPETISSQLSVKANNFNVGSFGGIRNLELTLQNDSKYLLDNVTVELKYLNPEGIILKTENIHFQSVYPGNAATIAVSKSKRGVKIAFQITKIESKGISGSTSGL